VLDAAWVLDPNNLSEVYRLAASDELVDERTWQNLSSAVRHVLKLLVYRTKRNETESSREEALQRLTNEFVMYKGRTGIFSKAIWSEQDSDVQTWWAQFDGVLLAKYARRLLSVVVTISNDERLCRI
jgi:hypothetical protein